MFSAFQTFGKLGALASSVARAWSPLALWPNGIDSPGMWISPSTLPASFNDSTGTTPVATPGSVADSANPVGLALDIRAGATVLTDPGNHMLQATSAARPLESARVNLCYDSYIQNGWNWAADSPGNIAITPNSAIAPNGQQIAATLEVIYPSWASATQNLGITVASGITYTLSYWARVPTGTLAVTGSLGLSTVLTTTWQEIVHTGTGGGSPLITPISLGGSPTVGTKVEFWNVQLTRSDAQIASQPVSATKTYPSTGITPWQLYDGVDDGMATASFAAGTLINGMDCMIAVRRDSAVLPVVAGLYQADQTKYFGVVGDSSGAEGTTYGGCGTPSIFVDGASVTNTRGALFDAMPVGDFHIIEYRGLDLSAWVNANFGNYGMPYNVNGARGDILLYPSTASTEDKDAARQYLANKYGVTLA